LTEPREGSKGGASGGCPKSAKAHLAKLKGTMSNGNSLTLATLALCGLALAAPPLRAQDAKTRKLAVINGPTTAKLGDVAQIDVPAGFVFIEGKTLRQ